MKRLALFAWFGLLLVGCNAPSPQPSATQLLGAPTSLRVAGSVIRLEAQARQKNNHFALALQVRGQAAALRSLKLTSVYVVTGGGVWSNDLQKTRLYPCAASPSCLKASTQGQKLGVKAGQDVQVVLNVQHAGKQYWLRDTRVAVR